MSKPLPMSEIKVEDFPGGLCIYTSTPDVDTWVKTYVPEFGTLAWHTFRVPHWFLSVSPLYDRRAVIAWISTMGADESLDLSFGDDNP